VAVTCDAAVATFSLRNSPPGGFGRYIRRNLKVRLTTDASQFSATKSPYVVLASCGYDPEIRQLPEETK
jgi:hypothetical protein